MIKIHSFFAYFKNSINIVGRGKTQQRWLEIAQMQGHWMLHLSECPNICLMAHYYVPKSNSDCHCDAFRHLGKWGKTLLQQWRATEFPLIPSITEKNHTLNNRCVRFHSGCRENPCGAKWSELRWKAHNEQRRRGGEGGRKRTTRGWGLNGNLGPSPTPQFMSGPSQHDSASSKTHLRLASGRTLGPLTWHSAQNMIAFVLSRIFK